MKNIEIGPIRPPSESNSLLVRVTRGCHWNKCYFCGLYKSMRFSMRPIEESKMGEFVREGSFTLQSEEEIMIEQKRFLQQLKEMDSYYVNEHIINLLLEVRGNLRTDKEKMLSDINRFLNLPANEKLLFVIGRRFNIFFMLDDLNNQELHKKAEGALQKILNKNPEVDFTVLCNYIRQSQI